MSTDARTGIPTGANMDALFDADIERAGSGCEKYDGRLRRFGRADVMPLWVADMDFAAPDCVQQALAERLAHPVFGYSFPQDSFYQSLYGWFERRHQWRIDPAQVLLTPGVVPSLFACVQALSEPGERILVPTPVYPPFFAAVEKSARQLVQSPLLSGPHGYELDFDHLQREAAAGARMLLLCSPHNPVGRVWRQDELERLIALALRHRLVIVSDDIHCDLTFPGQQHTPLARLAPPELHLVTAISASKTFNIPGFALSALVTAHGADRQAIEAVLARSHVNPCNPLSLAAFEAAYRDGDRWLDALRHYLAGNRQQVMAFLAHQPALRCQPPEATCLMWLDCRALNLDATALRDFFIQQAGLGLNEGTSFGLGGDGFMRLNIGTQRAHLEQALGQLEAALSQQESQR